MNNSEVRLPLSNGEAFTIIDEEDYHKIKHLKWYLNHGGYIISYKRRPIRGYILIHRVIMDCPDDRIVDHINGNKLDNRKENLRICTVAENVRNRRPHKGRKYKGVYPADGRYQVILMSSRKRIYGGRYDTEIEAAKEYNRLAIIHHGDYAWLNTF